MSGIYWLTHTNINTTRHMGNAHSVLSVAWTFLYRRDYRWAYMPPPYTVDSFVHHSSPITATMCLSTVLSVYITSPSPIPNPFPPVLS